VETAPEVLYGVSEGRHDAGVLLFAQGLYLARTLGIDGVRSMPLDEPFSSAKFRFAVPEGRRQLLAKLNDGLQNVRLDGSYDALYDEWLGAFKQESFLSTEQVRESVTVVLALAGFLAVALLWLWSLRREVEARTRELARRGEEKLELQRELLQSQKMEALGRLASGVAHDFNNLLTTIMGSTALAQNDVDPESGMGRILARVENASRSGAQLTRQLLTFSRRQAIEPRNVSWNDVVQSSREMLERLLGRRISVHYEPVEDLWMVRIDPGQASQIVMNLLINARDAISGAGQIWISAHNEERAEGEFVRLSVRDDGFGMDAETRRKIFEPFFTTKEHGRGTGLGMSTIHGIAEQHGGRVEVESQPGEGSTFHVDLPRSTESTEPDEPSETTHKRVDSPKERILFVEDEPNARATGAALLRELGHDVLEARSGETALALLRENPDVSTLITDVGLPGMSGVSLARQIATEGYAVRVLFCSGDPEALEFLDSHAVEVGFIEKPYTMESLAEALAQAPARHTPGSD
jgi:signal transduction histidine kinase/ActR/RegA family two-component response regulator